MKLYVYHKDIDCRAIVQGCPYLKVGTEVMTQRIRLITCDSLHIVLNFKCKRMSGSINDIIDFIETPWECPHLVKLRKQGLYPSIQASIH